MARANPTKQLLEKAVAAQNGRTATKLMSDKQALDAIRARMPELIDKLMELATTQDDRVALINLLDRVLGKPVERQELTHEGEWSLNITVK